ncbi:MAG: Histidine kinase, partial [Myxococcales bacterium]|nr:Histidine kinase [Myxococcales bacterium]
DQLFESEARVVSDEPRLKAVLATEDISRATMIDVAGEVDKLLQSELFLILDPTGNTIVDVHNPDDRAGSLADRPIIAEAIRSDVGRAHGLMTEAGQVFQVQVHRMAFGGTTIGFTLVGHKLDDRVAQTVFRETGSTAVVVLDRQIVAVSAFEKDQTEVDRTALSSSVGMLLANRAPSEISIGDTTYLAMMAPFPGYNGVKPLNYLILRSLDTALAPVRRLTKLLYGIGAAALFVAYLIAMLLSRRLARPLDRLVDTARRIGAGDLTIRARVAGAVEVQVLGDAMDSMVRELRTSRAQLERQYEELKELDALKDQFIANTSHELRTPINGILGLVGAVLDGIDGPLNAKQLNHLRMVKESGERLKNLVSNILEFSKLRAGRQEFEFRSLELSSLVPHLTTLGEGLLHGKPITCVVELASSLPAVWADREATLQILINLLGNAAKFTEQGTIQISAQVQDGEVIVSVEDTGRGIPPEARRFLFEEFRQIDGSTSRQYEGTGLGLAISKRLVESHGGHIDFESRIGVGTRFFFSLQTNAEAVPTTGAAVAAGPRFHNAAVVTNPLDPARLRGSGETVLVVDDNRENTELLKVVLEDSGYRTITASSADQALAVVHAHHVDLVLTDVRMPGRSGLELCREIKREVRFAKIPVFAVTAQASTPADLHAAAEVASDAYIVKPFETADLLNRIFQQLKPRSDAPRGKGESILVINDNELTLEMTRQQLRDAGYTVAVLSDPRKTLDMMGLSPPDLTLIDVRLANVSGFDVCQTVRSDPRFTNTPIILLSGFAGPGEILRGREVGANEFIPRPCSHYDLLTSIAVQLKRRIARQSRQGNGEKILVVDDQLINVEALAIQLEHAGYKALRALSGDEALRIARSERPHAIISDVMMPGMTGYDLCRAVTEDGSLGAPPVILLTAKTGTLQDTLLAIDHGAVDYLIKPFEPEELMARLKRALKQTTEHVHTPGHVRSASAAAEPVYETATYEGAGVPLPGANELILCVDDNPINLEILKSHLEAANYRTVLAKDGVEALAVLERDSPELILLDVMMPRMDGFMFLKHLRALSNHRDTPAVIVSAKDRIDDSLVGFQLGVIDFITKPFNAILLVSKVTAILALRHAQLALGEINYELKLARSIQQASFPKPDLEISGAAISSFTQTTSMSGGDWHGYHSSPEGDRLTAICGDVTGHSVSATVVALAAHTIKTTIELLDGWLYTSSCTDQVLRALEGKVPDHVYAGFKEVLSIPHSPAALASLINNVFCRSKSLDMSACVVDLHTPSGELRYAIGGAPAPLLIRGDTVTKLNAKPSSRLGDTTDARFYEGSILLEEGDTVVLYSDGLVEAATRAGVQYGNNRLVRHLRQAGELGPRALCDSIISDVFRFMADQPLNDDVTVLALRRTGR